MPSMVYFIRIAMPLLVASIFFDDLYCVEEKVSGISKFIIFILFSFTILSILRCFTNGIKIL